MNEARESEAVRSRTRIINILADADEPERTICHPWGPPDGATAILLEEADREADVQAEEINGLAVWSFDIDLTIAMPEDEPGCRGTVSIDRLKHLQKQGALVGTCSDRPPSNQRRAMRELGFEPDFAIPKELLERLGRMMAGARLIHVGDDADRDRKIAVAAGWDHLWPQEIA